RGPAARHRDGSCNPSNFSTGEAESDTGRSRHSTLSPDPGYVCSSDPPAPVLDCTGNSSDRAVTSWDSHRDQENHDRESTATNGESRKAPFVEESGRVE